MTWSIGIQEGESNEGRKDGKGKDEKTVRTREEGMAQEIGRGEK